MRHNILVEGYAYSLRPIELADAEFIVEVRTPDHSRYMHQISRDVEAQREFLEAYFQRPNEYYFVVERIEDRKREGLTRLLDFDNENQSAQWGSIILRPGSFAAIETALLVLKVAFDILPLREVWGVTLNDNRRMIRYVESIGFERRDSVAVQFDCRVVEATKHVLTRDRWARYEKKTREIARSIAEKLHSL